MNGPAYEQDFHLKPGNFLIRILEAKKDEAIKDQGSCRWSKGAKQNRSSRIGPSFFLLILCL